MTQLTIDSEQLDQLILQKLPALIQQNPQIQGLVLELARQNFAERQETEDRFYQLLGELKRDREEQARKWEEQNRKWEEQNHKWEQYSAEQNRKWEEQNRKWEQYSAEQNRKWEEQNRKWEETRQEFNKVHKAIMALDRSVMALGARWGIKSERSFRNALAGILETSFGVQVLNVTDYDDEGLVFGRPDQIELDIIIKNGLLLICELKSSMSRSDMYTFERKVRFYEKRHQRQANRLLVISPMVDAKAEPVAKKLGIEIYSDSAEVTEL